MFHIVRKGPRFLMMETSELESVKEYFLDNFKCQARDNIELAFRDTEEGYSIIFLTDNMKSAEKLTDLDQIIIFEDDIDYIFSKLINDGKSGMITRTRVAPRIIIMRLFGNADYIIDEISQDYNGREGGFYELLNDFNHRGTIVAFSQKPLNVKMTMSDLNTRALFVEHRSGYLLKNFRIDALRYINEGLDKKDWYEMEIKIYDRYSAYELHYKRLLRIIEILELGIILGESWSKDYPRLFMAVGVYRLRFFTFHDPKKIKRILLGLEHLEDGIRIVDYDLFCNKKKINWTDAIEGGIRVRKQLSAINRKRIYEKLTDADKEEMQALEMEIVKTRID